MSLRKRAVLLFRCGDITGSGSEDLAEEKLTFGKDQQDRKVENSSPRQDEQLSELLVYDGPPLSEPLHPVGEASSHGARL